MGCGAARTSVATPPALVIQLVDPLVVLATILDPCCAATVVYLLPRLLGSTVARIWANQRSVLAVAE